MPLIRTNTTHAKGLYVANLILNLRRHGNSLDDKRDVRYARSATVADSLRFSSAVDSIINPLVYRRKNISFRFADTHNFRNFI